MRKAATVRERFLRQNRRPPFNWSTLSSVFSLFREKGAEPVPQRFQTAKPAFQDSELLPMLEACGVVVKAEIQEKSWLWTLAVSLLPWVRNCSTKKSSPKMIPTRCCGKWM